MAERTGSELEALGIRKSGEEYLSESAKASVLVGVLAWLAWSLASQEILLGAAFSLLAGAACMGFLLRRPKALLLEIARKTEKHLPFALMQLSVDLNTGAHFDAALQRVARKNYGVLSGELERQIRAAKKSGHSMHRVLLGFAAKSGSRIVKRAFAHLVSVYEHGRKKNQGEAVRKIALEILSRQKAEAREFSGKVVVFSLAFIVVSAIVPALFQAFIIVGSSFMEIPFGPLHVVAIAGIVFPAIDVIVLLAIKSMTPEFMK